MILLQDKTNVNPPDSEFPFGSIRDRVDDLTPGTLANKEFWNDWHQLSDQIIRQSAVTPNGVLDSEYNGYQLWDAFEDHCKNTRNYQRWFVKLSQTGTSAPTIDYEAAADFGSVTSINRNGLGQYSFFFAGTPIDLTGKSFYRFNKNFRGYVQVLYNGTNEIEIITRNHIGILTDALLSSTDFYFYIYD